MLSKAIFLLIFATGGYMIGLREGIPYYGVVIGIGVGGLGLIMEFLFARMGAGTMLCGLLGLSVGILFAKLVYYPIRTIFSNIDDVYSPVVLNTVFGYSGLFLGFKKGHNLSMADFIKTFKGKSEQEKEAIIDTSAIIDGRIADVCEAGFLEGIFIIPQFILQELQHIADSSDSLKRARGRRGLDVLHKVQKIPNITVRIVDEDFPKIKEVDAKLVALAKMLSGKIITNEFNLNKVAELQGVSVLNINELASALKPVVLPGESMNVFIVKEGKESSQGVAYLEDGTMVVVDNARKLINKNANVTVTSVLQTTAGRMIFTKLKEEADREELKIARH
jgi:uncharacterized protein YacL